MLALDLDRSRDRPLHAQLSHQLRALISRGALPAGLRLPSSRSLARTLGISRNTVVLAYEDLLSEGWLEAGVGRGTFVCEPPEEARPAPDAAPEPDARPLFSWEARIARECAPPLQTVQPEGEDGRPEPIRLDGALPDPSTYPTERLRRIFGEVLRREGSRCLQYGPAAGYRPLREFIAQRSTWQGAPVSPDDVLIVSGSQQGLDLVARLLLAPGDVVLVEAPTYANALELWRLYGARPVGVPLDEQGLRPEALRDALVRFRPKLLYVMPTFQNPTGVTLPEERRRYIMDLVGHHDVAVVEDHFDSELRYDGSPLRPLHAFDRRGQVILIGTFSKILCPGLRLGWLVAPREVRQRILDIKRACDLTTSLPSQMALHELCARGELDRHLEWVRGVHARRLRTMLQTIDQTFPEEVTVTRPSGGMTLWVRLPPGMRAGTLHEAAARAGVMVAPGTWFYPQGGGEERLRLSFVSESCERIERGIRLLADLLARHRRTVVPEPRETTPFI